MNGVILHGDCLEELKKLPDNSIDSCVTDPPYGLSREPDIYEVLTKWMNGEDYHHRGGGFMGKTWDSFVPGPSIWREVFRVLKPGGHVLCFAGTRTQDLMTISLRLAWFEVRDVVEWLYFSGFPKSLDVGKAFDKRAGAEREVIGEDLNSKGRIMVREYINGTGVKRTRNKYITAPATELAKKWDGWHSALKPAHEPIILCRKPLEGSICDNVEKYGTGALNIDNCRIGRGEDDRFEYGVDGDENLPTADIYQLRKRVPYNPHEKGRFPANCVTTEPDAFFSKYFNVTPPELCKKASKKDRNSDWLGNEIDLDIKPTYGKEKAYGLERFNTKNRNNHPTVKPTDLMAWLIKLITPPGGTVLDPFCGSGSTLVAAKREGFSYVGIEREAEYVEIAKARTEPALLNVIV